MKILLDENMPESLLRALERLGHEVDSVNHLKLKGLDNGTLYRQALSVGPAPLAVLEKRFGLCVLDYMVTPIMCTCW